MRALTERSITSVTAEQNDIPGNRENRIRILPLHVANKIAAGEVVERPASALKELIENAIDAGADRIEIAVAAGGRKSVLVRDNGCGMSRDDALLSLERQATSKIRDVDDIERISTLGFRGEAIPSIAAVSRFTLVTRRKADDAGTRLVVNAGTVAEVAECGAPPGTSVEVRDLFCNVPARKKFLRSYATEEGHVKAVFTVSALAHPAIGFSLAVDGRELHRLPPGASLKERIARLFGNDFADDLITIGVADAPTDGTGVRIHGYISRPSPNPARREQFIFVNGRPASAPIIGQALRETYPAGRFESRPALFLFIDLPPTDVDVNVHPAKREVRFRHPADVKAAIIAAVTSALNPSVRTDVPLPSSPPPQTATPPAPEPAPAVHHFSVPFQPTPAPLQRHLPLAPVPTHPPSGAAPANEPPAAAADPASPPSRPPLETSSGPWRYFKVLAMTDSGYLLLETDSGIVTINPQAAQERIAYEKLMAAFDPAAGQNLAASQPLLIPETVHFSPLESARLKNFMPILKRQGFEIESFGTDTWKIDAVPALIAGQNASAIIASIVYDIGEAGAKRGERWREELIARSVARSFAGASTKLTHESAVRLVEDLGRTRMPYVCPRGKPVMIFTSNRELARKFGC